VMSVLLLAGIMLPMTLGPKWLQQSANLMPTKWVVQATRDLFVGHFTTNAVMWGVGWAVVLFGLGLWWGTSTFRRENA